MKFQTWDNLFWTCDKTLISDAFKAANGQALGDLGQDITSLGEDIYITVNGSQTIFVTDTDLKIRHQVNADKDGARLSPRYLKAYQTTGFHILPISLQLYKFAERFLLRHDVYAKDQDLQIYNSIYSFLMEHLLICAKQMHHNRYRR